MNYSIKLSEICNKFRIMACISPQYVSYISSPLLNTLAIFLLHYCYKERIGGEEGEKKGEGRQTRALLTLAESSEASAGPASGPPAGSEWRSS